MCCSEQGGHTECLWGLHVTLCMLQDLHSDNNHPSLDTPLVDQMVIFGRVLKASMEVFDNSGGFSIFFNLSSF